MNEEPLAILVAFRERYLRDCLAGKSLNISAYQASYPGFEAVIEKEYQRLQRLTTPGSCADSTPPDQEPHGSAPATPSQLGSFLLEGEIGRGGQGRVYRALDLRLGRRLALKVLASRAFVSPGALQRFRREASLAARLEHPAIATVYEAGTIDDVAFVAMQYVDGLSLRESIDQEKATESPARSRTQLLDRVRAFAGVVRAIQAAHSAGILHRDLKPSNLMETPQKLLVVLDFGLARELERAGEPLTRSGELFGTPAYMAPEQIETGSQKVDACADVYSLGVTLFEWLSGELPFRGATQKALFRAILSDAPADLRRLQPNIPRDLALVLSTAMAREPEQRYRSAHDLAEDLQAVAEGRAVAVAPPLPWERLARWIRRDPRGASQRLGLIAALLLLAGLTGFFGARRNVWEEGRRAVRRMEVERLLLQAFGADGSVMEIYDRSALLKMLQDHPDLILARLVATLTSSDPTELTALTEVQPASADEAAALQRICHAQDPLQPALEHALPVGPLEQFAAGLVALRESRGGNLYHYLGHEEHSLRQAVGFLANAILLAPESELLFYFTYANAVRALLLVDPEWAAPECARVAIALQTLWPDSAAALYSAAACMKATDLEHSAELYRRCVALDPHDVNSMLSLAWFELVHQDLDAAQDWYQRASRSLQITQRPLAWMQHRGYAKMLLSTGHPQAALRPLTRALELCPADLTSRALQGRVLLELDRADEAATELQTAVELQQRGTTDGYPVDLVPLELPTDLARADVAVHILLGMAHMRSQRAREAHVPLQTAVEMDPNSACASRWLRRALVQLADLDGHADELQRWIQINPADLHCVHELAKILIQRGHQEEAWLTLDQALEQASAEADENLLEELVALQSKLDHESIATVRQRLINGMLSYLQADEDAPADSDCGYTQAEIDECASIVDGYLTALPGSGNDRIMQLIREAVIRLNELNDRCGFALIETDQREDLCEIILVAARDAGLATSDDVTEEWREW